jgi:CheY-like chemotaxis protein
VEDNQANVAFFDRILSMSGDELHTYHNVEDALRDPNVSAYDVIITDIHFGENVMDGLDLVARLRSDGITTPIIAVTAYDFQDYERRSEEVGSDLYLVKPISPQQVVSLLNGFRN